MISWVVLSDVNYHWTKIYRTSVYNFKNDSILSSYSLVPLLTTRGTGFDATPLYYFSLSFISNQPFFISPLTFLWYHNNWSTLTDTFFWYPLIALVILSKHFFVLRFFIIQTGFRYYYWVWDIFIAFFWIVFNLFNIIQI